MSLGDFQSQLCFSLFPFYIFLLHLVLDQGATWSVFKLVVYVQDFLVLENVSDSYLPYT